MLASCEFSFGTDIIIADPPMITIITDPPGFPGCLGNGVLPRGLPLDYVSQVGRLGLGKNLLS